MQNPNKLNIHFILHEAFEVPGAYLKWAQWRGHNISATKVYEREALPDNVDDIDFLIVMGGPQSPDEDRQAFPYYDPQSELRLMCQAMAIYCRRVFGCAAFIRCLRCVPHAQP